MVILAIFAVAHALNQVELMVVEFRAGGERHAATARGGSILHAVQRFENYFRNPWYMLDMAVMGISLLYFILWYSDLSFSARAALSFNCILLQIRLLHCFRRIKDFGLVIVSLMRIASQVFAFLLVWLVLTIGFTGMFYGHFHDKYESYETWRESFITLILAALGDFEYVFNGWWGAVVLTLYIVFSGISLLSCLIAVMTEVFENVQDHEDQEFSLLFANEVVRLKWNEESSLGALPAPLNVFSVVMLPLKFLAEGLMPYLLKLLHHYCPNRVQASDNENAGREAELVIFIAGFRFVSFFFVTPIICISTIWDFLVEYVKQTVASGGTAFKFSWAVGVAFVDHVLKEPTDSATAESSDGDEGGAPATSTSDDDDNNDKETTTQTTAERNNSCECCVVKALSAGNQTKNCSRCSKSEETKAARVTLQILYIITGLFPLFFCLSWALLLFAPFGFLFVVLCHRILAAGHAFIKIFYSTEYKYDFEEFKKELESSSGDDGSDPIFEIRTLELVTAKVERQRAVQKTQAKELSRLFGAKKASFTLDEWMAVQVEAEEASKGAKKSLLLLCQEMLARSQAKTRRKSTYFLPSSAARYLSPSKPKLIRSNSIGSEHLKGIQYFLERITSIPELTNADFSNLSADAAAAKRSEIEAIERAKAKECEGDGASKAALDLLEEVDRLLSERLMGGRLKPKYKPGELISFESKVNVLCSVFKVDTAAIPEGVPQIPQGILDEKGTKKKQASMERIAELLEKLSDSDRENITEDVKAEIRLFITDVFGDPVANSSDLFCIPKGNIFEEWRAALLLQELQIFVEPDHIKSVELIEDRLKDISNPFTYEKLDRGVTTKLRTASKASPEGDTADTKPDAKHTICFVDSLKSPRKPSSQMDAEASGAAAKKVNPEVKLSSMQIHVKDEIWEKELSSTIFRLVFFSIGMTPDCNPLRFINKVALAIKNVREDFDGFPQAQDKMDSLLNRLQVTLVTGVSLQDRLIQSMDEGRLYDMLTYGSPSAIEIALHAENTSFLAHPSVARVVHKMFLGELFDNMNGSFVGKILKNYFHSEELVSANDVSYKHVAAKVDLKVYETPKVDGRHKPKAAMVHSNDSVFHDGAACLIYLKSARDGKYVHVEEGGSPSPEIQPGTHMYKAQWKEGEHWGSKLFDVNVEKINGDGGTVTFDLVYSKQTVEHGRGAPNEDEEATTKTDQKDVKGVPIERLRYADGAPIQLPSDGHQFYELADGRGFVHLPMDRVRELAKEQEAEVLMVYTGAESLHIYTCTKKAGEAERNEFQWKPMMVYAGDTFFVNAQNVQQDVDGSDWYELADGSGWIKNKLDIDDPKLSTLKRIARKVISFNAIRIPPTILSRPEWLMECSHSTLNEIIGCVNYSLKRKESAKFGEVLEKDSEIAEAFAKHFSLDSQSIISTATWIQGTALKDKGSRSYHDSDSWKDQIKEFWYILSHTALFREWYTLSLLAVEPQRYLRSPAARFFLEFVFFVVLMGLHYAIIDHWNDALSHNGAELFGFGEGLLFFCVLGCILNTYREIVDPLVIRSHGQSLDLPISLLYVVAYFLRFSAISMSEPSTSRNFCRRGALYILSVNSVFLSMRVITILGLSRRIGPMIEAFIKLVRAILVFVILLTLLIFGFAGFFSTWYGNCGNNEIGYCMTTDDDNEETPFTSLSSSVLKLVQATLGDFDITGLNSAGETDDFVGCYDAETDSYKSSCRQSFRALLPKVIGPFMFIVYAMTATITLLNLLVAVICELYADEQDSAMVSFMVNKVTHCIRLRWRERTTFHESDVEKEPETKSTNACATLCCNASSPASTTANPEAEVDESEEEATNDPTEVSSEGQSTEPSYEGSMHSYSRVYDPFGILALDNLPPPLNLIGFAVLLVCRTIRAFDEDWISERRSIDVANQAQFYTFNAFMALLVLLVLQVLGMAMIIVIIGTAVVSVTVIMFFLIFASGKSTQRAVEQTHPMRLPN